MRALLLALILGLVTTATASAQTKEPAKPAKRQATPDEIAKVEKFFDDFVNAIVKNENDCPKMGAAIGKVMTDNEAWLEKMAGNDVDLPQATKDRMMKKQEQLMNGVMKCKDDKSVQEALMRFSTLGKKKGK